MNWIFLQTLRGSFSAVSMPIFASKYSLESSRRDLQDLHVCVLYTYIYIFLHRSDLKISAKNRQHFYANEYWISDYFHFLRWILHFSANFWWKFVRISRQFPEKSDVCRFFNQICENKLENCRKQLWNLWKLFNLNLLFKQILIQYYSILFIRVLRLAGEKEETFEPWDPLNLCLLSKVYPLQRLKQTPPRMKREESWNEHTCIRAPFRKKAWTLRIS